MKFFSALMFSSTVASMAYIVAGIAEATIPLLGTPYTKEALALITGFTVLIIRLKQ